jgi:hypothetical protein
MPHYSLTSVLEILQIAIAPVVLISGVGLIILSQTNRMAHVISRIRTLLAIREVEKTEERERQIALLYERARMIRVSIISFILCIFFDALVILEIFISKILGMTSGILTTALFILSLLCLIAGIFTFLLDVNQNLRAVKIEIDE